MSDQLEKIGVLGCGLMGAGIAEVCARKGLCVVVVEANPEAVERGRDKVLHSLEGAVTRGKLTEGDRVAAVARLEIGRAHV